MRIASLPRFPKTQLRRKEWRNGGSSNEKSVHGWKSGPPTRDAILAAAEEDTAAAAAVKEAAEAEGEGLDGGEGDFAMVAAAMNLDGIYLLTTANTPKEQNRRA